MWSRSAIVGLLGLLLIAGCAQFAPTPIGNRNLHPSFPECQADGFDFVGEGTLRELGLDAATAVSPADANRPAKIWVTSDLMTHDAGPVGGPVEMTRMLCFEFGDGSGGSGWPVDPAWRPPGDGAGATTDGSTTGPPFAVLAAALVAGVLVVVSFLAFRTSR